MKNFTFVLILFLSQLTYSQVGVGNVNPQATLDITASSSTSPANNDGILIPRMSNFPSSPGATRDGMLIFYTGASSYGKGFYYWDQNTTSWTPLTSVNDADWFEQGSTNAPNSINDNIYKLGKISLGSNTLDDSSLYVLDSDNNNLSGINVRRNVSSSDSSAFLRAYGSWVTNNSTAGATVANFSFIDGNGNATNYNNYAQNNSHSTLGESGIYYGVFGSNNGTNRLYGNKIEFAGGISNTGFKYGYYVEIPSNLASQHYGIYSNVQNSSGYAGYFLGRTSLGNSLANRYIMPATDGTAGQVMTTDGAGQVSFTTLSLTNTQNTLDEAYDEGGAGTGRTITADSGAVLINGTDGIQNTGTFGSGATLALTGTGTKMFFYPRKAAFRAGYVIGTDWNDANIGNYSTALGSNTIASGEISTALGAASTASGEASTAFGSGTTASGYISTAFGVNSDATGDRSTAFGSSVLASGPYATAFGSNTQATGAWSTAFGLFASATGTSSIAIGRNIASGSFSEIALGMYNNQPVPISTTAYNASDQLFSIGNGTDDFSKSNALTIYKSGLMNINDAYNMPLNDGTSGQVMTTDGAGQVSFTTLSLTDTQNTLDQAYDEGGAGAGRIITADNGAVSIEGTSGFQVTGTYNTGAALTLSGAGTRLLFNPRMSAFRAGSVDGAQWDLGNVGNFSIALGTNTVASGVTSIAIGNEATASGNSAVALGLTTTASGINATAFGSNNTASGGNSTAFGFVNESSGYGSVAFGYRNIAHSSFETVLGAYATNYSPVESNSSVTDPSDRVLVVGNGTSNAARSNALTLYKNGSLNINDAYTLPNSDGTSGQILTTDGAGVTSWATPTVGTTTSIVRALLSSSQLLPLGTPTKISFDTTLFDTNSDFDTTNNRFVAPRDGYYRVNAAIAAFNSSAGGLFVQIYKNGTWYQRENFGINSTSQFKTIDGIVALNAGEYVEIFVNASPANYNVSIAYTFFEIQEIK